MASETSSLSQTSTITTKDEFEWVEIIEFDANVINELLYEPIQEVESCETLMHDVEVMTKATPTPGLPLESYWCSDQIQELENFNWLDMVEQELSEPCTDIADWYGKPCMEEINEVFEIGDYSFSQNGYSYDEIGYIGLWQENQD
ncbi:hypothetical protein OROHE_022220 [Orobanche hederae]